MKNWYVLDKFGSHYVLIEASSPKEAGRLGLEWFNGNGETFTIGDALIVIPVDERYEYSFPIKIKKEIVENTIYTID